MDGCCDYKLFLSLEDTQNIEEPFRGTFQIGISFWGLMFLYIYNIFALLSAMYLLFYITLKNSK